MVCNHAVYGTAAATIAVADGPDHRAANAAIADVYDSAATCNSTAKSCQAAAAASIGPAPGPVYIRPEVTSGG